MKSYLNKDCKDKTIFVTGGAGFLGSEIVKQISASGGTALVYDNFSSGKKKFIEHYPKVKIIKGDVRNRSALHKAIGKSQYIINLAALPFIPDSFHYPQEFFDVNTNGTLNLILETINQKKIKNFVHISTSEVYGSAKKSPMDENHPILPQSTYAVSKLAGEKAVFTMHKEHGFPAVMIRPFNTFGPRQTARAVIPTIASQLISGKEQLTLGALSPTRDFNYVTDTARGMLTLALCPEAEGQVVNIGSGDEWSISETVNMLCDIAGREVEILTDEERIRPEKSEVNRLLADNTIISNLTDWTSNVSFQEGLERTYEWIEKNIHHFDVNTYAK